MNESWDRIWNEEKSSIVFPLKIDHDYTIRLARRVEALTRDKQQLEVGRLSLQESKKAIEQANLSIQEGKRMKMSECMQI